MPSEPQPLSCGEFFLVAQDFDLLGDPIPEGWGKRGRPVHMPTDEKRRIVMQLAAFDWTADAIASALSITAPTLRKHYFRELKFRDDARFRLRAKVMSHLMAEVEKGNVGAIKEYLRRLDMHELGPLPQRQDRVKAEPKVGKKVQAIADAQNAHEETGWRGLLQ